MNILAMVLDLIQVVVFCYKIVNLVKMVKYMMLMSSSVHIDSNKKIYFDSLYRSIRRYFAECRDYINVME